MIEFWRGFAQAAVIGAVAGCLTWALVQACYLLDGLLLKIKLWRMK